MEYAPLEETDAYIRNHCRECNIVQKVTLGTVLYCDDHAPKKAKNTSKKPLDAALERIEIAKLFDP